VRGMATAVLASLLCTMGFAPASAATAPTLTDPPLTAPPAGYSQTAADLTSAYVRQFWNRTGGNIFSAPMPSAETVASDPAHDNGYTFWPSIVGLHALVEGEKQRPGGYAYWIWTVYSGLEQYWNPDWHCYMAWLMFPGNDDSYYDDNAWAVITLVDAYTATRTTDPAHAQIYLSRANDLMSRYEVFGWDNGALGGMMWGTSKTVSGASDRTVSATAGAALAAFVLAEAGQVPTFGGSWLDWGTGALAWVRNNMVDSDHLVMDGVHADGTVMRTKWTYNTGVTIRALAEHYRLSGSANDLTEANTMAYAAIDHTGGLFDNQVNDPELRFWWDGTYFEQYLVDGLLSLRAITGDAALGTRIADEVTREAGYTYTYIRDPFSGDEMYWRNLRLYRIGPYQTQQWQQLTGQTHALDQDPSEMSGSVYVKTLLANAAVARMFWLTGTV
jgi:hypothetical protein